MGIHLVKTDIFTTGAKYMAHQCNCVSIDAAGIAKIIFEKYPYSNVYKRRYNSNLTQEEYASIPGEIEICGDGLFYRGIINMFAQYYPGKGNSSSEFDSFNDRKKWFHQCLMKIADIENLNSIAFPYKIGCSLAGGNWEWYEKTLTKFADYIEKKQNAIVLIYKND